MTPPKKSPGKSPADAPVDRDIPADALLKLKVLMSEFSIGKRIKEARLRPENELSIEALSRLCKLVDPVRQGIARTTLVRYEAGDVLPGARELRILCDALGLSADWLIMGRERHGVIDLDVALDALSRLLKERLSAENPISYPNTRVDLVRPMLLAKAKEPKPRK